MKIYTGSDHAGFSLKKKLLEKLAQLGQEPLDLGTDQEKSCDYPDFAHAVARKVLETPVTPVTSVTSVTSVTPGLLKTAGLLICGSGIGMSIAANRHAGIRAALCHDPLEARLCREHNDANILVLGARLIGEDMAFEILQVFLNTAFSGGRHINRIRKIELA